MQQASSAFLCVFLISGAVAQTPPESPILVKTMSTSLDKERQETFKLKVTNVSGMNVKGFVLRLELLDATGKVTSVTNQVELKAGGPPSADQVLIPGEYMDVEWTIPVFGQQSKYNLSTDYVALMKGPGSLGATLSTLEDWGPDQSEMSERVKGLLVGTHDERTRLRQLGDAQGSSALSRDLDTERALPEASVYRSDEYRIGLRDAYSLERQRLHGLRHQQGIVAVISDLEQDR